MDLLQALAAREGLAGTAGEAALWERRTVVPETAEAMLEVKMEVGAEAVVEVVVAAAAAAEAEEAAAEMMMMAAKG